MLSHAAWFPILSRLSCRDLRAVFSILFPNLTPTAIWCPGCPVLQVPSCCWKQSGPLERSRLLSGFGYFWGNHFLVHLHQKSAQGLLALRPLSDFLAVRRFREVPKTCFSPSWLKLWSKVTKLDFSEADGLGKVQLEQICRLSLRGYLQVSYKSWSLLKLYKINEIPCPQHLDLSEKNFIEVDSSLLADAFSRFSPSIIEETTNVRSIVVGSLARTLLISLRLSDLILGIENTVQCLDFVR